LLNYHSEGEGGGGETALRRRVTWGRPANLDVWEEENLGGEEGLPLLTEKERYGNGYLPHEDLNVKTSRVIEKADPETGRRGKKGTRLSPFKEDPTHEATRPLTQNRNGSSVDKVSIENLTTH